MYFGEAKKSCPKLKRRDCTQQCTIYMDNYFTSVKLFARLREMGIGACGTASASTAGLPERLKRLATLKLGDRVEYGWNYMESAGVRATANRPGVHAFAEDAKAPPAYKRFPQMRRPDHDAADGVGLDGSANCRASSTAPCALRKPAPSVSGSHAG